MSTAELSPELIEEKFRLLAELENDFDAADVEILRETTRLHEPLLERRQKIISTIPGFWPHVLDEASAPIGLEEHIQPDDTIALSALTSFHVCRPNALNGGDPRDVAFEFVFEECDFFPAQTVKKLFTHQGIGAGISGLISEPVQMQWKDKKDLTKGVQKAAVEAFEERKEKAKKGLKGPAAKKLGEKEKALVKLLEKSNSFFNWFSYTGPHKELGELDEEEDKEEEENEDDEFEIESPVEAFSYGDEVAVALAEDLYPNAVKYFTSSITEDAEDDDSEIDIEDDSEAEDLALKEILAKQAAKNKKDDKPSKKRKEEGDLPAKKKAKKDSA